MRKLIAGISGLVLAYSSIGHAAFQQLEYSTDNGLRLRYAVAAPAFNDGQRYPLWIFQPGDGTILNAFQPEQYRLLMEQFAESFGIAFVMPEIRRNLYANDLKSYCELDFFHRVSDLSRLIEAGKSLAFVDTRKIILFGHSAGGEVTTLVAQARKDIWGVATYGTGVISAGETGNLPVDPDVFSNDCSDPAKYSRRSGIFWRQLFLESKLYASIQALSVRYMAMFGGADPIIPFDATEEKLASSLAEEKSDFSFQVFPGLDHGGFTQSPAVFQALMQWAR